LGARAVGLEGREIWVRWAPEGKTLSIRAEIVLGADGPLSRVGRWVGSVNPHLLPAIQVRARLREPMEHTEIYLEPEFRAGYGWLFPKKGWANVGVGMQPEGRQGGLASTLKALLGRLVATGKVEPPPVGRSGGWIPVGPPRRAVFDRILLAGDAAGHAHPITGGGVAMAVSGGALAGTWAARAVGSGSMALLERYEEAWRDLWGETLATASEKRTVNLQRLEASRELSWERFGKRITFYLPGMFKYDGMRGRYPAVSITGSRCSLQCDHCMGRILESMPGATDPEGLVELCGRMAQKGASGVLISGGCDPEGRLPWGPFLPAIAQVKRQYGLYISVHCGLVDKDTAVALKEAGVDQALLDVVGDDETYRRIYHVPFGVCRIRDSLKVLEDAQLEVVPHIVVGLHGGRIRGERRAIEMVSEFDVQHLVLVSLMRIPRTPSWHFRKVEAWEVSELICAARFRLPRAEIHLGCARERGNTLMETLAVDAGVTRMALPSEEAIKRAASYGLEIRYQRTCCSVSEDHSSIHW